MNKHLNQLLIVGAVFALVTCVGCEKKNQMPEVLEQKGPMQRAGEKMDDAAQKASDALKDAADKTKAAAEDAAAKAKEAVNNATK